MSKPHIAMLLSNAFRPDPRVLKEANSLASLGYKVTVISWDRQREYPKKETLNTGVDIIRVQRVASAYGLGAQQLFKLPQFWRVAYSILNQLGPDLVHCHDFDTLPVGLFWGRIHRRPVIYDAHEYYADFCKPRLHGLTGGILYRLIRIAEKTGARFASAVVTVDESLAAIYRTLNKQVLILGHYPTRTLVSQPAPVFTHTNLTLLYIGRLSIDRGLLHYADLLRLLRSKKIPARLYLAGTFTPASDEAIFRNHSQGLDNAIDIAGWVHYSKIPGILQQADVGLSILQPEPRYIAALPVKMFEYMAAGLPVVASNFSPIAKIINDAECGILVDPLDPQAAADAISEWWENPDQAKRMGNNGYQAISQKYNWETLIEKLHHLYVSLIQNSPINP